MCINTCRFFCMDASSAVHVYVSTKVSSIQIYLCKHTLAYVCTDTYSYTCIYTYIYMYTHIHIRVYSCTYTGLFICMYSIPAPTSLNTEKVLDAQEPFCETQLSILVRVLGFNCVAIQQPKKKISRNFPYQKKIHQTWLQDTLHHILTYIAALETHVYNMTRILQPP